MLNIINKMFKSVFFLIYHLCCDIPQTTQINSLTHWTVVNDDTLWEYSNVNAESPDAKLF